MIEASRTQASPDARIVHDARIVRARALLETPQAPASGLARLAAAGFMAGAAVLMAWVVILGPSGF